MNESAISNSETTTEGEDFNVNELSFFETDKQINRVERMKQPLGAFSFKLPKPLTQPPLSVLGLSSPLN